jgi:hypothetical protein
MTPAESITLQVAAALDASGMAFMLTGSFASNFYGIPRSTRDADFVLQTPTAIGPAFSQRLGADFVLDPQLTFETQTGTFRQGLRHRKNPFKVELFLLSQDEHDQARFQRRREVRLHNQRVWLPSPEDVVITKLRWARGKDRDDARDVMAVQRERLDWKYIEEWCNRHGTLALMREIRDAVSKE